jgi:hypothetical protein
MRYAFSTSFAPGQTSQAVWLSLSAFPPRFGRFDERTPTSAKTTPREAPEEGRLRGAGCRCYEYNLPCNASSGKTTLPKKPHLINTFQKSDISAIFPLDTDTTVWHSLDNTKEDAMQETYIRIKMSEKQKAEMVTAAAAIGETLSSYVRRVVLLNARNVNKEHGGQK